MYEAAVERVPEIKAEQVEEVFFGNVLSAKYGTIVTLSGTKSKWTSV